MAKHMSHPQDKRNSKELWGLILIAIVIGLIFHVRPQITGIPELDGLLAVFLGFYLCARAAANFLNAMLFEFNAYQWKHLSGLDISWLGLNSLLMLSGLILTVIGLVRFFSRALLAN